MLRVLEVVLTGPVVQVSLKMDSKLLQPQVDLIFPADWQFEGYV